MARGAAQPGRLQVAKAAFASASEKTGGRASAGVILVVPP
jgi:hypothetical protein